MVNTVGCTGENLTDNILPFLSNFILDTCRIISKASLHLDVCNHKLIQYYACH